MALVLVVDDDADIVELLTIKLDSLGHDVITASDGASGVAQCRARLPDLVLMDWMMPVLTGLDALREIRGDASTAGIPVIIVTARSDPEDLREVAAAGADAYLGKPFSLRTMGARVEALLASRR